MRVVLRALPLLAFFELYGQEKSIASNSSAQLQTQANQDIQSQKERGKKKSLEEAIAQLNANSSMKPTEESKLSFSAKLQTSGIMALRRDATVKYKQVEGEEKWYREITTPGTSTASASTFGIKGSFYMTGNFDVPFGRVRFVCGLSLDAHAAKKNKPLPQVLCLSFQSVIGDIQIGQTLCVIESMLLCGATPLVGLRGPKGGRLDDVCAAYDVCGHEIDYEGGLLASSNSPKFVWTSPILYGFKMGLSYTPDSKRMGFLRVSEDDKSMHAKHVCEGAIQYIYGVPGQKSFRVMCGYRYGKSSQENFSDLHCYHIGMGFFTRHMVVAFGFSDNLSSFCYEKIQKYFGKSSSQGATPPEQCATYPGLQKEKLTNYKTFTAGASYSIRNIIGSLGYMYTFGWNYHIDASRREFLHNGLKTTVDVEEPYAFAVKTAVHIVTAALQYKLSKQISVSMEYNFILNRSKKALFIDHVNGKDKDPTVQFYSEDDLRVPQKKEGARDMIYSDRLRKSIGHVIDIGLQFSI